ncbi:MAG: hypothetical protein F6K40_33680 [Okeania sp. SIO3I5]|uniref:hypothetical protein n=1 Tax=Okeania sp. SIO3I5 TaxID=2607805 RepID=UPI0013BD2274|nr:hypothetical protein [Okeania sp. SIO3I5]NEQ40901.1 hypothetical protein [Okeania sp. SIO3I5]
MKNHGSRHINSRFSWKLDLSSNNLGKSAINKGICRVLARDFAVLDLPGRSLP